MSATDRRSFLGGAAAAAASIALPGLARAQANPGVSATELKIGTTTSLSGPQLLISLGVGSFLR